jgi:acyl-CoA reductase-like NAD-dependent aldehyde dehydrogenase
MARRLGIYTLGHYLSLPNAFSKKIWNPLLKNYETWELSYLDTSKEQDQATLDETLEGMFISYQQILKGFFPLKDRVECLERIAREFSKNFNNLASILSMEIQKPIKLAQLECERSLDTIKATIEVGLNALESSPPRKANGRGLFKGTSRREPRGIALGVTPFNFPYNLSLHKIAPALLAGTPLIWRPSEKCHLTSLALVDILHAAKVPAGLIAFLPMTHESFWKLLEEPKIACISFTGSEKIGWKIRNQFKGPLVLELGGTAPVYVEKIQGSELEKSIKEITTSAFSFAGQSCISAQNLVIQEDIFEEAISIIKRNVVTFPSGDAREEETLCAGVIDEEAFKRIEKTLLKAKSEGAEIYSQQRQENLQNFIPPTIIFNPSKQLKTEEVFAPLLNVFKVKNTEDFISFANSLPHRLQAAIYSNDVNSLKRAESELDFGGVALNLAPSVRVDSLPYGGRGQAGSGSEDPQSSFDFFSADKTIYTRKFSRIK